MAFSDGAWAISVALAKHMVDDVRCAQLPPSFDGELGAWEMIIGEMCVKQCITENIDDNMGARMYCS